MGRASLMFSTNLVSMNWTLKLHVQPRLDCLHAAIKLAGRRLCPLQTQFFMCTDLILMLWLHFTAVLGTQPPSQHVVLLL